MANAVLALGKLGAIGPRALIACLCLLLAAGAQANEKGTTPQASDLLRQIQESGRAVVQGIHFKPKTSEILPESDTTIVMIAQLFELDPELKLVIVGHTDNTGSLAQNVDLSRKQAMAVLNALVREHKVSAGRLQSWGAGSFAPVASNATDEGRAKNRRIELVRP